MEYRSEVGTMSSGSEARPAQDPQSAQEQLNEELLSASLSLNVDKVSSLLEQRADVNYHGGWMGKSTPLLNALKNGRLHIVTRLLAVDGIEANVRNSDGQSSLQQLCQTNNDDDTSNVERLIQLRCDPNDAGCDPWGAAPLWEAASKGLMKTVQVLLAHGAAPNPVNEHNSGWSALHMAADCCHVETVTLLLEAHADATIRSTKELGKRPVGLTALDAVKLSKAEAEHDKTPAATKISNANDWHRFDETIAAFSRAGITE